MSIWRLVSGILSIIIAIVVFFQSCAVDFGNTLLQNGEVGGTAGVIVAICLLAGGIISVVTWKGSKGGSIAMAIIFGLAAFLGIATAGSYGDLYIWSGWCWICAALAVVGVFLQNKNS